MTKATFVKRAARPGEVGLFPVGTPGRELLARVPEHREVMTSVKVVRNPKHHNLFFQILKFCVEHCINPETGESMFENTEQAKLAVKIACGEVDAYVEAHAGKTYFVPRSIAWESMDQTRFAAFFDRATWAIANRWMPAGTTAEDVRAEIMAMIEGPMFNSRSAA